MTLKAKINGVWTKIPIYAVIDAIHTRFSSEKYEAENVSDALEEVADKTEAKITSPINPQNGDILMWNGTDWVAKPKWQMMYQPVEYVESTGTQYINTGYRVSESGLSRFYIECEQNNQLQYNTTVFGTYMHLGENYPIAALNIFPSSPLFKGLKYDESPSNIGIVDEASFFGNKHTVDLTLSQSSYTLIVDGVTTSGQFQRGDLSVFTYPFFLFARSSNEEPVSNYAQIKIGRIKFYDSTGNIRRDFVPCYRLYDSEIGMYETVEGKFYANAGTGTFLKGADV